MKRRAIIAITALLLLCIVVVALLWQQSYQAGATNEVATINVIRTSVPLTVYAQATLTAQR